MLEKNRSFPFHIIVRMPNWLGDLVMATPILADIRQQWPYAHITAMCQGQTGALLEGNPHINKIFSFNKPRGLVKKLMNKEIDVLLRKGHYDLGILLTNSLSSAWWFWRGYVKKRIGYAAIGRNWLLTDAIPFPKERHQQHLVKTYKMLLSSLNVPLSQTAPALYISEQERQAVRHVLESKQIALDSFLIGINPGAAYGSAKCWLPERYQQVAKKLLEHQNVNLLFFGDKAGASLVQEICTGLPSERVLNLAGQTTLRQLMTFIQSCRVFLTNDSGPMHIASALNVPLVALFGSTSDVTTGPYKGGKVIHKHVACSPCYRRTCPIDFRCMKNIEVEEVYQTLNKLIDKYSHE